jgi:hypothetical protein
MRSEIPWLVFFLLILLGLQAQLLAEEPHLSTPSPAVHITLVKAGQTRMPILAGSLDDPIGELTRYLKRISGADIDVAVARKGTKGIYVGLVADFPWLPLRDIEALGPEGFLIRSQNGNLLLIAHEATGVQHAVTTFLHHLGCRWFFPGEAWAVIPSMDTIEGTWNERQMPDFPTQRSIWYGYGAYRQGREELDEWNRHNRMGGPVPIKIHHSSYGLDFDADFRAHPEWFALLDGQRQATKPCFSHPAVLKRAIAHALEQADKGLKMITVTPPDGLGYCECSLCLSVFEGVKPFRDHRSLFAERPDGVLVNITSETLFKFVNRVADAVSEEHPGSMIGCYAYSAYSHPPSFDLHDNVYVQTTTAFRRTPLTMEEQIKAFGRKTRQLGIREYYSVFQWDWDYPDPGKLTPKRLQEELQFYRRLGITAINAESSNNWGPRGLGYYIASQLMWDADADWKALIRDFYLKSFGPAAGPMEKYFVHWYGTDVAVLELHRARPEENEGIHEGAIDVSALREAFGYLDEAVRQTRPGSPYRNRIDQLRMYLHYLVLRYRLDEAAEGGDEKEIFEAIKAETLFGGRLTHTGMVHGRALIGKAFLRRFRKFQSVLEGAPEAGKAGSGWRQLGQPPSALELKSIWEEDRALLAPNLSSPAPATTDVYVFRDVTAETGLREPLKGMMGHAAAWGDVNADGWVDLFVGTFADRPAEDYRAGGAKGPVPNMLFINNRGRFSLSGQESIAWLGRASGSVMADLDNDGLSELYVANNGRLGNRNLLYHNRGKGQMVDVTAQTGAPLHLPETARSALVFDFDGDALLDLLVLASIRKAPSMLFRNLGDMKFERSHALPDDLIGLGAAAGDLTGNGRPDLFVGGSNRLFVNMGGRFREAVELDLDWGFTAEDRAPSCGVALGDFDHDGNQDILIGAHTKRPWGEPSSVRLLRNLGSTTSKVRFEEVTKKVGIASLRMRNPHVEMRDFDNDGWPDLYTSIVTFKDGNVHPVIYRNGGAQPDRLPEFTETGFIHRPDFPEPDDMVPNESGGRFFDRMVANGKVMYFAPGPSADFDGDGRLDLFLPCWFPRSPSLLLRNETPSANYLEVEVIASGKVNRQGIGAMVQAYRAGHMGEAGELLASEEIATGYGYCSGQPPVAHLGLGTKQSCDLIVRLPWNQGVIQRKNVKSNQRLKVKVGDR